MLQRLISAAVLVPVVVIPFVLGDPWLTMGIAVLAALAAYEAAQLVASAGLPSQRWFAPLTAIAATILVRSIPTGFGPSYVPGYVVGGVILGFFAVMVMFGAALAMRSRDPRIGFLNWAGNLFAALYSSLLGFAAGILVLGPPARDSVFYPVLGDGRVWLLVLVLTVWAFDTFAYVAGKYHGRGRFMNHISPNKTWSGVVGGSAAALLVCTYLSWAAGLQPLAGLVLGLIVTVSAQAGDLAESMLKRAAGVKDSGTLIPGHGGFLDRVDSFLFAAPAFFVALILMSRTWAG